MIFQPFKIKELIYIHPTKSYNLTNSQLFCNDGKVPVVTNTSENYGRSGFSNLKPTEHDLSLIHICRLRYYLFYLQFSLYHS